MTNSDIIEKIHKLRRQRNWSVYNLALEAGLTQSTLASMLKRNTPPKIETLENLRHIASAVSFRNTPPKIETLENICDAFGLTLSQFFACDETTEYLSSDEKNLICAYRKLTKDKKQALLDFLKN